MGVSDLDELVTWLRRCIEQRKYLAEHTMELGNAAEWTELSSGVLVTARPDNPQDDPHDRWDGVHPMGDSSLTRLMEANDPRDTIARCEFELAMLDDYAATLAVKENVEAKLRRGEEPSSSEGRDYMDAGRELCAYESVARRLGYGYRHWPGYKAEWKP
jgi:hypothetical protein